MWRTRPVFVSSTFADMQFERDFLRARVFPALEERLRDRREHLEWVDLRLGIATASLEEEKEQHLSVLKVCLAEVRRCRPFMIVLVGDRYGWVPPTERVEAAARDERVALADVAHRSVTDLEIDFGILSDHAQRRRSFVYFRNPLDYAKMPPQIARLYSESCASDSEAADRVQRLAALKERIAREMPERVRTYTAQWDNGRVTGLDEFGARVLDDLLAELTADRIADVAPPWSRAQRNLLDAFIEDRARDFTGREALLDHLVAVATGARPDLPVGACITGEAGAGKSALFGALHGRLKARGAFVLAHAAGASASAPSVDDMLLRWIVELSALLGRDAALADDAPPDAIEATFASLLVDVAASRRVVLLVDALDQFEPTTRGKSLTWLPQALPAQVCLVATAIPDDASETLCKRAGIEAIALAPIDAVTARRIVERICGRYHRAFEPAVVDALLGRQGTDGPAWGNPLWLVLATEDLNLLDADDFARTLAHPGRGDEQLRAVMLDAVEAYPGDIQHLYHHVFERVEKHVDRDATRAFLQLTAISRSGWRELDLRELIPRVTGRPWNALTFAQLRRMFRGQLHRQDHPDQWNFNHAQMRVAARIRLLRQIARERTLHALVVDHLLSLADDDPLRESETMFHILAAHSPTAATLYLGDPGLTKNAETAAVRTLADVIVTANDPAATAAALGSMILEPHEEDADVADEERVRVSRANAAHRLLYVNDLTKGRAPVAAQQRLLAEIAAGLERARDELPGESRPLRDLAACRTVAGDVLMQVGQHGEALQSYRDGLALAEDLLRREPGDHLFRGMTAMSCQRVGDALANIGRREDALSFYRKSLAISEELAAAVPHVAVYQEARALSLQKIGEVLTAAGATDAAGAQFRQSIAILEGIIAGNLSARDARSHLAQSYLDAALIASARDPDAALDLLGKCLALRENLVTADPRNMALQREAAIAQTLVGDALQRLRRPVETIAAYRHGLAAFERVAASDPMNLRWQHDLSLGCVRLGRTLLVTGYTGDGVALIRRGADIGEALVKVDAAEPGWMSGLVEAYGLLAEILLSQGRAEEAAAMQHRIADLHADQAHASVGGSTATPPRARQ